MTNLLIVRWQMGAQHTGRLQEELGVLKSPLGGFDDGRSFVADPHVNVIEGGWHCSVGATW